MGNTASSEVGGGATNSDGTTDSSAVDEGPTISGVSLGKNLQAKVVEEFNAKVHAEWIQRAQNRQQQQKVQNQIESEHEQYLGERKAVHQQLDEAYNRVKGTFHDKLIATDYDASALQEKYVKQGEILGTEAPCSEVRNNYVNCQQNNGGKPSDCEIYVQALQDCVTKTLTSS